MNNSSHLINECAGVQFKDWAPDARARVTGQWVDYRRGLFCTVACAAVEPQALWWWAIMKECVSDCVSTFTLSFRHLYLYLLLDLDGERLQLSISLLTLPAVVRPILTPCPWNCTFIPLPVLPCRCGQIQRRCVSMCADAVISHTAHHWTFHSELYCFIVSYRIVQTLFKHQNIKTCNNVKIIFYLVIGYQRRTF